MTPVQLHGALQGLFAKVLVGVEIFPGFSQDYSHRERKQVATTWMRAAMLALGDRSVIDDLGWRSESVKNGLQSFAANSVSGAPSFLGEPLGPEHEGKLIWLPGWSGYHVQILEVVVPTGNYQWDYAHADVRAIDVHTQRQATIRLMVKNPVLDNVCHVIELDSELGPALARKQSEWWHSFGPYRSQTWAKICEIVYVLEGFGGQLLEGMLKEGEQGGVEQMDSPKT